MKKGLRSLNNAYTLIAMGAVILLVVAVIPLLLIGLYAHPCADDYSYGYYTHAFWNTTGSLSQTLHWAFYQVKATYDTWQGTFASVFLMALSPAIWGEGFYFLTPVIMLFMIICSHFFILKKVIIDILECTENIWVIISSVISFLAIETMFVPVEGLYWYNGAVHYVFMHSCMLLLFGLMIGMIYDKKQCTRILQCIFACVISIVCGGSNYPTALLGILGTVCFAGIMLWKKKRISGLFPLIIYGIAFYLNVSAYGNKIRQANFVASNPFKAILESFSELLSYAGDWITLQMILFMLLLLPIFWKLGGSPKCEFRLPVVVTLLTICSNACMLTPGLYAMGIAGAGRTINIIKMWFVLMLFLNEAYWLGYLRKKLPKKLSEKMLLPDVRLWTVCILVLIFVAFIVNTERRMYDYSSYAAFTSLRAGEAQQYHKEYLDRVKILTGDSPSVEILPFSQKPYLLYFDDITGNKYDWRNTAVARWYGKENVYLRE